MLGVGYPSLDQEVCHRRVYASLLHLQKEAARRSFLQRIQMHYHSKKAPQQTISIPKNMWASNNEEKRRGRKKEGKFFGVFNPDLLKSSQPLPRQMVNDFKVTHTNLGHFYLCIPQPLKMRGDNQAPFITQQEGSRPCTDLHSPPHRVIALDPGVWTFHTGYDV